MVLRSCKESKAAYWFSKKGISLPREEEEEIPRAKKENKQSSSFFYLCQTTIRLGMSSSCGGGGRQWYNLMKVRSRLALAYSACQKILFFPFFILCVCSLSFLLLFFQPMNWSMAVGRRNVSCKYFLDFFYFSFRYGIRRDSNGIKRERERKRSKETSLASTSFLPDFFLQAGQISPSFFSRLYWIRQNSEN